jgi:hypothetical protein
MQMNEFRTELRDGMQIDWDVPIPMDDGLVLRADVFRPVGDGKYPVLMSYGPYGKGLSFQEGYSTAWNLMAERYPDAVAGSSNLYQAWEVVDPEKWVPDGYICIRVDSRGAGRSPGVINHHSPREIKDFFDCIEWAGVQAWSNGKVGLNGISYFACNQWRVAAMQPPHLAAMCVWEGYFDRYRDSAYHGGIRCTFTKHWREMQIKTVQHGVGERGARSKVTGVLVCGDETLDPEILAERNVDLWKAVTQEPLNGPYFKERMPDASRIKTPLLSAGNWGGQGLHLRGNVEGFLTAASEHKWLEIHGGEHWTAFYTDYGVALQKRFFNHFLKGEDNGWLQQPRVQLQIREVDGFVERHESSWPLPGTQWKKAYLDLAHDSLTPTSPAAEVSQKSFDAQGVGLSFDTKPFDQQTEITGPLAARLYISSSTSDADVFLVMNLVDPQGKIVHFQGAIDSKAPFAQGWLRASHRKLDPALTLPYRPYHAHDEVQPLTPGGVGELEVEIWPTSLVVPKGYSIRLTVQGKDYDHGEEAFTLSNMKNPMRGCGPFVHDDPADRPSSIFGGTTTLHSTGDRQNYVLLPFIDRGSRAST